jgi:hypothetical protein
VFDRGCGTASTTDNPQPLCTPKKIINIGLNAGQTPPANVPVVGNNAFQNAAPENAAAILGSLTTRSCDIDFWPNIDYLATKSPTSQKIIVNVDLNNDNVWLLDKATATVFGALGSAGSSRVPGTTQVTSPLATRPVSIRKATSTLPKRSPAAASRNSCR